MNDVVGQQSEEPQPRTPNTPGSLDPHSDVEERGRDVIDRRPESETRGRDVIDNTRQVEEHGRMVIDKDPKPHQAE